MTNEKFEQILQRTLTPEIDNHEVFVQPEKSYQKDESGFHDLRITYNIIHEKARFDVMKGIFKITAVTVCATLIIGVGVGWNAYLRSNLVNEITDSDTKNSAVSDNSSSTENSFVLKVGAEEISTNKDVPLTIENNGGGSSISGNEDGNVEYCISADLSCEGEGIESVTYSINKGTFAIVEASNQGSSLITSGTLYEGDANFPGHWSRNLNKYDPETIDTKYYTEYTLDYASQKSDRFCINICGEVYSMGIYNRIFDSTNTPEDEAEANTELMKGVEITCTVHYADGTSDSETVVVECQVMTIKELGYPIAPDDDPNRKVTTFVYKLK